MADDRAVIYREVRKSAPDLTRAAIAQLDEIAWFSALSADVRSWVGVVVQTGVDGFVEWLADPKGVPKAPAAPFAAVPAAAARAVSLEQTVELIRVSVDVISELTPKYAPPGSQDWVRAAAERYGRELGFAAALVYARVAERRGAWDARLQAQLVDALIAGADERTIGARASALGWPASLMVRTLAAPPADSSSRAEDSLTEVQNAAGRLGRQVLAVTHGSSIVVVVGATDKEDPLATASALLPGRRAVVVGPVAATLLDAGDSVRAALAGLSALAARPDVAGPISAGDLLAERALNGDPIARAELVERCYTQLKEAGGGLLETADAIIVAGGALEPAARSLPIHVNTLRYRLERIQDVTGLNAREPHQRFSLQVGLVLGRISDAQERL